jgi:hypothetical protein
MQFVVLALGLRWAAAYSGLDGLHPFIGAEL